jgi:hypothetical protein
MITTVLARATTIWKPLGWNATDFLTGRHFMLDLLSLGVIIPDFDILVTCCNDELFSQANIHSHYRSIVILLMNVFKIDLLGLGAIKCYIDFHKLVVSSQKVQHILCVS